MLSQDDIKHSQGFHTILIFLATYHICYGLHRNLCSKTKFNFKSFRLVRAPYSLSITLIWIITPIRTCITIIIPAESKLAPSISNKIQLQKNQLWWNTWQFNIGKIDIHNPTFHPSTVNNPTFGLFSNNRTFVIHLSTTDHITYHITINNRVWCQ